MPEDFDIRRIVIPKRHLNDLEDSHLHSLLLLGHIFNEMSSLAKLADRSRIREDSVTHAEKAGAVFYAGMFSRLLVGKIHEAYLATKRREVSDFLAIYCFPHMLSENERSGGALKSFRRNVLACKWLIPVRNGHAMHYPEASDWADSIRALRPSMTFDCFFGKSFFNTLFYSSDVVATHSFFSEVDAANWKRGLEQMIADVVDLSHELTTLIFNSVEACARGMNGKGAVVKDVKKYSRPNYRDFVLPYFFDIPESQ